MLVLPDKIKDTLARIRTEFKFHISLKKINGKHYVYKQTTIWNKETKKLKVFSTYLGRITEDGAFVKKEVSQNDELENAKAIIVAHGGKVILPKPEDEHVPQINELIPNEIDKKILMTLSMNSRASLKLLSNLTGLTNSATYNRVKNLEKKYGIKYIAEINTTKFGYNEFLVTVKFLNNVPDRIELVETFSKEYSIQLAMTTKGDYDVLLYVLAKDGEELKTMISNVRSGVLSGYNSIWTCASIDKSFGYIPLREEFVENLKAEILTRERVVLKELNSDGIMEFTEIDKKYNFDSGRSQYTYHKLMEKGILERTTIKLENIPMKYIGIIDMVEIDSKKFERNRRQFLEYIVNEEGGNTDRFLYRANTVTPDGSTYLLPIKKEGDLEREIENCKKLDLGVKIGNAISTSILIGSVCLRLFDMAYSLQQVALVRDYKAENAPKTNYFETGRKKRERGVQNGR